MLDEQKICPTIPSPDHDETMIIKLRAPGSRPYLQQLHALINSGWPRMHIQKSHVRPLILNFVDHEGIHVQCCYIMYNIIAVNLMQLWKCKCRSCVVPRETFYKFWPRSMRGGFLEHLCRMPFPASPECSAKRYDRCWRYVPLERAPLLQIGKLSPLLSSCWFVADCDVYDYPLRMKSHVRVFVRARPCAESFGGFRYLYAKALCVMFTGHDCANIWPDDPAGDTRCSIPQFSNCS